MLERIRNDLKDAMKRGEKLKISTLRMTLSEVHKKEIDKRGDLTEQELIAVISKAVKNRKESIEEFKKGGRDDLAEKEQSEIEILEQYLPKPLTSDELDDAIQNVISELDASSPADFGKVMKEIMNKYTGRVDGKEVNERIKKILGG